MAAAQAEMAAQNMTVSSGGLKKTANESEAQHAAAYSSWNNLRDMVTAPDSKITDASAIATALNSGGFTGITVSEIKAIVPEDPTSFTTTTTPYDRWDGDAELIKRTINLSNDFFVELVYANADIVPSASTIRIP